MEKKKAENKGLVIISTENKAEELNMFFESIDQQSASRDDLTSLQNSNQGKLQAKLSKGYHFDDIKAQAKETATDDDTAKARLSELGKCASGIRKSETSIQAIEESLNDPETREKFDNVDSINPKERLTVLAVGITPQDDSKSVVRNLQGLLVGIAALQEIEHGQVSILPNESYYGEIPFPNNIAKAIDGKEITTLSRAICIAENMPLELAPLKLGGDDYKAGTLLSIRTNTDVSIDVRMKAQKVTLPECASQMIHKKQGRFAGSIESIKKAQRDEDKAKAEAEKAEEKKNKLEKFIVELPLKQVPIYFEKYTGEKAGRKKEKTLRSALSASKALFTDVNSRSKSDTYKAAGKAVKALIKE